MTIADIVFALVKIAVILLFALNMGGVLTWVERRQMSMIQDRVGPNRAVVFLPMGLVKGLLFGVAGALALAALGLFVVPFVAAKLFGVVLLGAAGGAGFLTTKVAPDANGMVGIRAAGLLHPLADGLKFIAKEDFVPEHADKLLHGLAPAICLFPVFVTMAVIPFGDTLCVHLGPGGGLDALLHARIPAVVERYGTCADGGVSLQLADLNVGILYMFALGGTGIIGAAAAGWASDNKYSLLGGLRAASQMVSYEVAMGLSLVGAFMTFGSLRFDAMVQWQSEHAWGIFVQPFAFFLFFTAAIAENKRVPFDAPEGESEIVAGYLVEYSGMKFAMFYMSEYVELAISSAVMVTVFLGGWALPFLHRDGITIAFGDAIVWKQPLLHWVVVLIGFLAFLGKTVLFVWANIFIRWTLPRFRYDQIMALGWKKLLPLAMVNMVLTAVVLLAIDQGGEGLSAGLQTLGDISQAAVALGGLAMVVWFVTWAVRPIRHEQLVVSTSARLAAARGGVKTSPMQA